jgi:hypothetical protein
VRKKQLDIETDSYQCANPACRRWLGIKLYLDSGPEADVPPERVHRITDPRLPPIVLFCTCGHFTVNGPQG